MAGSPRVSFARLQTRTQHFTLGTPRSFRVARDGSRVLFLRAPSGVDKEHGLYSLDVTTGEETCVADPARLAEAGRDKELSTEERAARERSRTRAGGVVGYSCDEATRIAVFSFASTLHVVELESGEIRPVPTATPILDPRPDPTGRWIAYASSGAVRVVGVDGDNDRVLVGPSAEDGDEVVWGLAEFIAAEEMGRSRGYWWSPDGDWLLAQRSDSTGVPRWHIADPTNPDAPPRSVAYPAAGTTNVDVRLVLFGVDGSGAGTRVDVEWDREAFPYLATAHWSSYGPPLLAVQSRDQRTMRILAVDTETGATEERHTETDERWVDVFDGVPAWTSDGRLVHVSARDGAYRLIVGGADVSGADLQVRAVLDVNGDGILFRASADDPTQVHVYHFDGTKSIRMSTVEGVHSAARGGDVIVLNSWSLDHAGPRVVVRKGGRDVAEIASLAVDPPVTLNLTLLSAGERELRCALLLPTGHPPGSAKLPVVLDPYGGPHAQRMLRAHNAFVGSQWLADQGFAVLVADGRGTPGRGPDWDRALAFDFAGVTLADQVDALHAVAEQHKDLDLSRVAIRGWSYGGYLSALAVLRRPDVFHAAIAGAPVTDWRLYDTHYTERYLGHPGEKPEVYERNSLLVDADRLSRPLLLIHGLVDDNVFVAHTLRLSQALLAAGRAHEVWPLSGVTHMSPSDEAVAESFQLLQLEWLKKALGV